MVYDSDDSHSEMSSDEYSTFTKACTNDELEFGEIIFVRTKNQNGHMKTERHTSTNPVWNIHGLCYLAIIKIRAFSKYIWPLSPNLKWLTTVSHQLRSKHYILLIT